MAGNKSPSFNWNTMEFNVGSNGAVLVVEDELAVKEVAVKAQQTPRGVYTLYADPDNVDLDHKYGSDVLDILTRRDLSEDIQISELKRAIKEALVYDPWITDVKDIKIYTVAEGTRKMTYVDYTLVTTFDKNIDVKGAGLNG